MKRTVKVVSSIGLSLIGLLLVGVTFANQLRKSTLSAESPLKVAYPLADAIEAYDPAVPPTAARANLIYSLFSNLVIFDNSGSIQTVFAESFQWNGDSLRFRIKNRKTIDGKEVTAKDAAFSLKRLILLSKNAHGDLANFLCPSGLTNIKDECAGIKVEGNDLILTVSESYQAKFLLPLLTASDFAVVPMSSIDLMNPKLPLIDYRNTSGSYYVSSNRIAEGELELRANQGDPCIGEKSAKHILLIKGTAAKARDLYASGAVDAITTIDNSSSGEIATLGRSVPDSRLHFSEKIRVLTLSFSESYIRKTTPLVRLAIGQKIKAAYMRAFGGEDGAEATSQFFPKFGDGSLEEAQLKQVELLNAEAEKISRWPPALLWTYGKSLSDYDKAFAEISGLRTEIYKSKAATAGPMNDPDLILLSTDASYYESISLVSYEIDTGAFGLSRKEGVEWLNRYMNLDEKSDRLAMLRQAHLKMLLEARIVPIAINPYASITRKPWNPDVNPIAAITRLCLLKHD